MLDPPRSPRPAKTLHFFSKKSPDHQNRRLAPYSCAVQIPQKISWRPDTQLRIGDYVADPASNEISADGKTTRLRPILMDVLLRLAADAGSAVNRETLLNDVWPRRMVNDEVLSRAIAELRTALGDDPKQPRYIETLPKVGYRLIAKVVTTGESSDLLQATGALPVTSAPPAPAASASAEETLPTLTEAVALIATTATAATAPLPLAPPPPPLAPLMPAQRMSLWKVVRLPLVGLAALALYGVYKTQPLSPSASRQIELERQISAAMPFATSPQTESNPRFSPDGKSVVFARSGEAASEIVIQDVASGVQRAFSAANARLASPVFMPDGKRVAYWLRRSKAVDGPPDCAIALRDLERAIDDVLVDCQQRPQPVFDITPDGSALIFAALPRADYPLALLRRDLLARTTTQLTAPTPGDGHDAYPRVSPDGKTLAFFRGTQSHARLWTLPLAPAATSAQANAVSTPQPASPLEGLAYGVAWLSRGNTLLTAADWLGFRALNTVSLADGSARLLGARGARFPDIARDGSIVFESATYRADLWLTGATSPGDAPRLRWPSTRYSNQPEFSPDGKRVVFASNRSGSDAIHIASLDPPPPGSNDEAKRLPFPPDARYIQPHWSADGNAVFAVQIAITADRPAAQRVVRIDLASNTVTTLSHLGQQVNNAVPLADDRDIVYGELVDHAMRLQRVAIAGGAPQRLPLPMVSSFAIVDNDLVYTQPQLSGATYCALDTLKCTPLKVPLDDSTRFDWTLGKGVLWYAGRNSSGKPQLVRLDLNSGEQKAFDYAPSATGTNVAASRDGQALIVVREAPAVVDLMMAKPLR